jgi:hypothetical protein
MNGCALREASDGLGWLIRLESFAWCVVENAEFPAEMWVVKSCRPRCRSARSGTRNSEDELFVVLI